MTMCYLNLVRNPNLSSLNSIPSRNQTSPLGTLSNKFISQIPLNLKTERNPDAQMKYTKRVKMRNQKKKRSLRRNDFEEFKMKERRKKNHQRNEDEDRKNPSNSPRRNK